MLQTKVAQNSISYKKLNGSMSTSSWDRATGLQKFTIFEILAKMEE